MEPGSILAGLPRASTSPLCLSFLIYKTKIVVWTELLSWQRAATFTKRKGLYQAMLVLLTFYRGAQRGHVICSTSHSQVTPEPELWAQAAVLC